jgi:hypothetical protein
LTPAPARIQEDAGRGTEINLRVDQLRVLDYLVQAGQTALVSVSVNVANRSVEYWLPMTIEPIAHEPLGSYLTQLQNQWEMKLREMSPSVSQHFEGEDIKYAFRMRYQGNMLRVWFAKE